MNTLLAVRLYLCVPIREGKAPLAMMGKMAYQVYLVRLEPLESLESLDL